MIRGLYENIHSCVTLPSGTTPSFHVDVGIPQGCPISPYLFIIATEMLAVYVEKSNDIQKLDVLGTEIVISLLADDTTLVLKNEHQVPISAEKNQNILQGFRIVIKLKEMQTSCAA